MLLLSLGVGVPLGVASYAVQSGLKPKRKSNLEYKNRLDAYNDVVAQYEAQADEAERDKEKEEAAKTEAVNEPVVLPNNLLIIVDPQVDFTTGSLATAKGPAAMDYLAKALEQGAWKNYSWIIVTQDAHPTNHCSFVEQGGVFPPHCVQETEGMNLQPSLQKAIDENLGNTEIIYLHKGDLADKEEFSVFQNELSGEKLRATIEDRKFEGIDVSRQQVGAVAG